MRRGAGLLTLGLLAATAADARADERLQGTVSATTGYTDNILSASDPPQAGMRGPEADAFSNVSPGLILSIERPRVAHVLQYLFTANLYLEHSEANSYTNRLSWQAAWSLTPLAQLLTGIAAIQGELHTFDTSVPGATDVQPLPEPELFINVQANESYLWDFSQRWHLAQTLLVGYHRSLADVPLTPDTYDVNSLLTVERAWKYDAAAAIARVNFTRSDYLDEMGELSNREDQLLYGLEARWRHDIGNYWSSELRAGAVMVSPIGDEDADTAGPVPSAAAILRYLHPEGTATLTAQRDVRVNLFTGSTYVANEAQLYAALPFDAASRRWTITGRAAYQLGRTVSLDGDPEELQTTIFQLDATLATEVVRGVDLALRYQYHNQENEEIPMPEQPIGDYQRQTLLLTLSFTYPRRPATAIPFRAPLRVDRRDQRPMWDHEQPQAEPAAPPSGTTR